MTRDNREINFREILRTTLPATLSAKTEAMINGERINEYKPEVEQGNDNLHHHLNNFFEIACNISGFEQTINIEKLCEALDIYFEMLKEMKKEHRSPKQLHNNRQITFMALIVFHNRVVIRERSDFQDHFFETILSNITNKYNNLTFDEVQVLSYIADCLQNPDLQKRKISKIFDDGKLTLDEILKSTADGEHLLAYKGAKLIKNFPNYDPKSIIPSIIKKQKEEGDEKGNLSLLLLELIKEDPDANQYLLDYLGKIIQAKTEIQNHKNLLIELLNSQKIVSVTDKMLLLISLVMADIDEELKETIKKKVRNLFLEETETPIRIRCFLLTSLAERGFLLSFENDELEEILTKIVEDLNSEKDLNIKNRILRHFIDYKIINPQSKEAKEIAKQIIRDLPLTEENEFNASDRLRILRNLINRQLINKDENLKELTCIMLSAHLPKDKEFPHIQQKIELLKSLDKEKLINIHSPESQEVIRRIISELVNRRGEEIIYQEEFFKTLKALSEDKILCEEDYDDNLKKGIFTFLLNIENQSGYQSHFFYKLFQLFPSTNYQENVLESLNQLNHDRSKVNLCLSFLDYSINQINDEKSIHEEKNNQAITNISIFLEDEVVRNLFLKNKNFAKELLTLIDRFSALLPNPEENLDSKPSGKTVEKHSLLERKLEQFPHIRALRVELERKSTRPSTIITSIRKSLGAASLKLRRTSSKGQGPQNP